ncbi:hypothetical protein PMW_42 [Pseudomonas phage phiPMW]|uniref:Uncharacterized protein n=1 Tax=Pseudomonas phage phiPMW TaxID=1815582 RepID=A0A1S5R1B2_9CAUD|nr:hypothetical protein FDG97_gp042 [Pseudomonas phage phiPMW]ANA49167.1 hypothetical protein PMW_42 [Pseudomonas phage phiPMW]
MDKQLRDILINALIANAVVVLYAMVHYLKPILWSAVHAY